MHKLLVLYHEPNDPAHFRKYYAETHLPLASKLPGLKASRYSFDVSLWGPVRHPISASSKPNSRTRQR
jgi:uncharacterized protein (TIGR02118 family)